MRIVDFDDIESIAMARNTAKTPMSGLWRFLVDRYARKLAAQERRLGRTWNAVTVCSDLDVDKLRLRDGFTAQTIPNAVDFAPLLATSEADEASAPSVLFVGTFSYGPNVFGIQWFVHNVWPQVVQAFGAAARLEIVGFEPPADIFALDNEPGVSVLGTVDDLSACYRRANIVVVPIFSGGGTRIKLIEAFAFECAVVTTTIGCEGLGLRSGVQALIADDVESFVMAVISLARAPKDRQALARTGRLYGQAAFSRQAVEPRLEAVIVQAAAAAGVQA